MLAKTSIGVGFYGRSHGGVASGLDPSDIPGSASNGSGMGGTIENGVYSFFDLYKNYIGPEGNGINGWKTYFFPDFGGDILYNESKGMAISYQSPLSAKKSAKYVKDKNLLGVFSWTVDDDNGMLLEALHSELSKKVSSVKKSYKPHIYAPDCSDFGKITFKPGMVFKKGDAIYKAKGWATKCPGEGESWE